MGMKRTGASRRVNARWVTEILVRDPDTGTEVPVEIWKDPESGGIFGIDATFLEDVMGTVRSPFNAGTTLILEVPE